MTTFLAIDFETAEHARDSACALGVVLVRDGRIVAREAYLMRPPSPRFAFTWIHGLTWEDVRHAPTFGDLWPELCGWFEQADFLAAHNAAFDRAVLAACCARHRLPPPARPFQCTMWLARERWGIRPTRLPDVCRRLGIALRHHDALSDAEACARIVLAAARDGWQP